MEFLATGLMFAVFLGLYALLRRRSGRSGPVQWWWLAAIAACALAAIVVGVLTR